MPGETPPPAMARKLSDQLPPVFPVGFGCMGLDAGYGDPVPDDAAEALLRQAVECGVTMFDTAELYGPFTNEERIGKALRPYRGKVLIATKFGARIEDGKPAGLDSRPEQVAASAERSLRRLGVERIDLFYQHRVDPKVPIEDVAGAVGRLIEAGKVGAFGLSEAGAQTLRRAHAVQPVAAVQSEYSIWTRDPEKNGVLAACGELGVGFVAFSPLGRGYLAGAVDAATRFPSQDARSSLPRFSAEARLRNLALAEEIRRFGAFHGMSPAQLSLAWLLARQPWIVPIPGSRNMQRVRENAGAADVRLEPQAWDALEERLKQIVIHGERYPEHLLAMTGL